MTSNVTVSLEKVSKVYKRYHRPADRLKEILLPGVSRAEEFWALRDINLEIPKGETVGIIGRNGSGKSTLLQIIAGTLQPSTGKVNVHGRVSALLELGSGFNPEFTGRQNVFFNGRILGLSKEEIENRFDDIAAFADIGEFIDQPVKTYSSGMFVRLAFAVAVHVQPEVFIVDEALAVGDIVFQHKCMRRIKTLMDSGVTTLFVSHDAGAVKSLCNYAFMLSEGRIFTQGKPNNVFIEYMKMVTQIELEQSERELSKAENNLDDQAASISTSSSHEVASDLSENSFEITQNDASDMSDSQGVILASENDILGPDHTRRGSGLARITNVTLFHEDGSLAISSPVFNFNEEITLVAEIQAESNLKNFILGFLVCDKNGNEILGSNTHEENVAVGALHYRDRLKVKFSFKLPLRQGGYSLTVAGAENYGSTTCDWIDNAIVFRVLPPSNGKTIPALVDIPMTVDVEIQGRDLSNPAFAY
jgi:lipopolysaccharide transport system ATP-binding protein